MSDFLGFKESYVKSEPQSAINSGTVSSIDSYSPSSNNNCKQKSLNIPAQNIKQESSDILSRSYDIKKQLSSSFQGSHGGVSKPQPRRNSVLAIKSNAGSDAESEDDDDNKGKGNNDDQGHERKRRDNINDKIQELLALVPADLFQEGQAPAPTANQSDDAAIAAAIKNSGTKDGKPNKGQILTKSVEYIQYLQNLIDENNRKEVELVLTYKKLQNRLAQRSGGVPVNVGHTSAEKALGEIGVGPLSGEYFKNVLRNNAKQTSSNTP